MSCQSTRYYSYDTYGNPLSIGPSPTNPCPSGTSTCLGYDALARLSSVVEANNGPTIALTYNAMGLRAGYTVTPYGAGQPSLNEQFTYRGGQLAQTVTISGTTSYTDTYVYSQHGMPLELLRTTYGVLNRYWYERDGLGNVVALTDAGGTVVDQYAYDLWGKPTLVQESVPQQLRYQGYWYDNELGWYWLTSRAYDPTIKRFLQPDPSEMDGLFSYVYVGDDPVDGSDPSGFGPDTGIYYRVVSGPVDKLANWQLRDADLPDAIRSQEQYYSSDRTNPELPVLVDGLSVWATADQAAANYKRDLAAGKAHGTGKIIAITEADLQAVHLQAVQDPVGNDKLAAKLGDAYDPLKTGHYLLIPNTPGGVNPGEQGSFADLGTTVSQVEVGRVTAGGNIVGLPPAESSQASQSSSIVADIANAIWTASVIVVKSVAEATVAVAGATFIRNQMMAF